MSDEVYRDVYRIEVPLPDSPLKAVNCYLIKGPQRNLLIDTGMNRSACRRAIESGLKALDVDLNRTDFFITHFHSDHLGLVSHLIGDGSTVYFNRREAAMIAQARNEGGFSHRLLAFARAAGFSDEQVDQSLSVHPGLQFHAPDPVDFVLLDDGDFLPFAEFNFECIATPGHSPGHLCLYDEEKKLMFCGDHVLGEISPNISAWDDEENPLSEFLENLDKVADRDVDLALPGHRGMLHDFQGRIEELKAHHEERLNEVLNVLDGVPLVAYDVASRMTWALRADHWEDAGILQRWFATGEAIAHLRYLEHEGRVQRERHGAVNLFSAL